MSVSLRRETEAIRSAVMLNGGHEAAATWGM